MFRTFLLIVLFYMFSNASIINFEEEKYIEVLDNSIKKTGTLEFLDDKIKLKYTNSKRILTYQNDSLSISIDNEIETIDLKSQVALKMIFILIESIHKNNLKIIEEYFIVNNQKNFTSLIPKDGLENYILSVEFKKNKKLEYITIHMTNGNKTTIREIDD